VNAPASTYAKVDRMTSLGNATPTVPQLLEQLQARDRSLRLQAAAALGLRGRKARPALSALTLALKDEDVHVRRLAALALGDLGADAPAAVAALIEALHDKHPGVRRRAAVALGEIGAGAAGSLAGGRRPGQGGRPDGCLGGGEDRPCGATGAGGVSGKHALRTHRVRGRALHVCRLFQPAAWNLSRPAPAAAGTEPGGQLS
jgi:hypothetical protein